MPAMIFQAACERCGEVRKFIEFKVEACTPGSVNAPESEYGFRCMTCKMIVPETRDAKGALHLWTQGRHEERWA